MAILPALIGWAALRYGFPLWLTNGLQWMASQLPKALGPAEIAKLEDELKGLAKRAILAFLALKGVDLSSPASMSDVPGFLTPELRKVMEACEMVSDDGAFVLHQDPQLDPRP